MAYQLNSKSDSRGDEQLYMELFNRLRPQIETYKKQRGGDLEGAFQKVTGQPWPSGRSVKISHGVPEMTTDRTFKSVLGKYVLPAALGAAAVFAPAILPTLGKFAMKGGVKALAGRTATGAAPGLIQGNWKQAALGAGVGAVAGGFGNGANGVTQTGGNTMKDLLLKSGIKTAQNAVQNGFKDTGQSGVSGDIMSGIMNRGVNQAFDPRASVANTAPKAPNVRPQGW